MSTVLAASKRFALILSASFTLAQGSVLTAGLAKWTNTWWMHRQSILILTTVNTAITTTTEFVSRSITAPFTDQNQNNHFFIQKSGGTSIHRQSLINIWMTIFASLFGGPVYFFLHRRHRFLYFVAFGSANSFLSQGVSSLFLEGSFLIASSRLYFDLIYNGTIKFCMFEWLRQPILKAKKSILKVGYQRSKQDLITTTIRVTLLNFFGFKG